MGAVVVKEAAGDKKKCQSESNTTSFSDKPGCSEMSCETCNVTFSIFKRKKKCLDCGKHHCSECLTKEKVGTNNKYQCQHCKVLTSGNFTRNDLMKIKIKDLRHFLQRRNVSTQDCREKDDLIELILSYSNNSMFRQQQEERQRHLEELKERKRQAEANSRASLQATRSSNLNPGTSDEEAMPNTSQDSSQIPSERIPSSSDSSSASDNDGMQTVEQDTEQVADPFQENTQVEDFVADDPDIGQDMEGVTQEEEADRTETTIQGRASLNTLKEVKEIEDLTVRQLKEILAHNFVDYKGCCEKWELMERVKRLWQSHQENSDKVGKIISESKDDNVGGKGEDDVCKICMDAMIDCVLLECGHMVTCTLCGKRMSECPVCRQYVSRVVHIFKA